MIDSAYRDALVDLLALVDRNIGGQSLPHKDQLVMRRVRAVIVANDTPDPDCDCHLLESALRGHVAGCPRRGM